MRLSFVGNLVDSELSWLTNTAKKFADVTNEVSIEFHQKHEWLRTLRAQSEKIKLLRSELPEFCEPSFGLHIPWEPKKYYRVLDEGFDDKTVLAWLKFCAENNIELVNMHLEWGDGIGKLDWRDDENKRDKQIKTAADNLKNIISFVEANNIKLSIETLPSFLYDDVSGRGFVDFPAFPTDYLKLRKLIGFEFGINPDVSHTGITWYNIRNNILDGIYKSDSEWFGLTMEGFFEKFIKMSKPSYQIHVADFAGNRNPSQHAMTLGEGFLTDKTIKTIIKSIDKKTVVVLEIKEDWKTMEKMRLAGYLPNTMKSLEKLKEFLKN
ncbi:MAG: TIM barrel protein [Candidatus Aenigmatarchaeota archaeon]